MTDEASERSGLSRRLFPDGTEPDPRFTLANERTFLAWIRTALALVGGGIALEAFPIAAVDPVLRRIAAILLAVLGLVVAASAMARWVATERAMRRRRPLPVPTIVPVLAVGSAFGAVLLLVMIMVAG